MLLLAVARQAAAAAPATRPEPIPGGYAVVVSRQTHDEAQWREVVAALQHKYGAETIVYDGGVVASLPGLRRAFPKYACFVARPEEAGRDFVVNVHRLTRKLDDDPYTDVLWGILTGYGAEDALRIASASQGLVIRTAGAGTGLDLSVLESGKWFSEGTPGEYWAKQPGGEPQRRTGPADSTEAIVAFLNDERPDLFITSGHATERDWQIGYSYRNGQLLCRDGRLYGLDLKRGRHAIRSPNPKVYLASGNCLIGNIPRRDCMALAWLSGSGGARQMVGYTVSTWYGAMGWGTRDRLLELPGRHNVTEAFYFTNQELIRRLHERFAGKADVELERFDLERDRGLLGRCLARLGYRKLDGQAREYLGMLWDRDTVAFYGDPAWDARLAPRDLPLTTQLAEKDGTFTFAVHVKRACRPSKPLAMYLPHRVADVKLTAGGELEPLIADNFIMLMKPPAFEPGRTYRVVFTARRAAAG
jgi:zinc protease